MKPFLMKRSGGVRLETVSKTFTLKSSYATEEIVDAFSRIVGVSYMYAYKSNASASLGAVSVNCEGNKISVKATAASSTSNVIVNLSVVGIPA